MDYLWMFILMFMALGLSHSIVLREKTNDCRVEAVLKLLKHQEVPAPPSFDRVAYRPSSPREQLSAWEGKGQESRAQQKLPKWIWGCLKVGEPNFEIV